MLVVGGVYVGAFAVLASVLLHHPGFPLDDSWIHQTLARHFARYHLPGYLPGVASAGSSSLLWSCLLALAYVLVPGHSPVAFNVGLSALFLLGAGAALRRVVERDGLEPAESWLFALAPAASGPFLWLGLLGMEHLCFVTLSVLAIVLWFEGPGRLTAVAAALALGLLTLTRPEGLFLTPLLLLLAARAGRTGRDALLIAGVTGVCLLVSFRINWLCGHTLLPGTMKGRQWLYFSGPITLDHRLRFLRDSYFQLTKVWSLRPTKARHLLHYSAGLTLLVVPLALIAAGVEVGSLLRRRLPRTLTLLVWTGLLQGLYFLVLPSTGHGGRYQPLSLFVFLPLVFAGAWRIFRATMDRTRVGSDRLAFVLTALLLVVGAAVSGSLWRRIAIDGLDQMEQEHQATARWLQAHFTEAELAPEQLAVFDIGRIGYALDGRLTDLGGLTDPAYQPYLYGGRVGRYLEERRVAHLVLPEYPGFMSMERIFTAGSQAPLRLERQASFCFDMARAQDTLDATNAAAPCQVVFAVHSGSKGGS